jgi:hypothetical protein
MAAVAAVMEVVVMAMIMVVVVMMDGIVFIGHSIGSAMIGGGGG